MRKLAQELNVQAPSLYSYYRTKEELLNDVVDRITANIDVSGFKDGDWKRGLIVWARSYRDALAAHPNMVAFIASGPGRREEALRRADAIHGGLVSAGWPARLATMIGASTRYLVVGAAINSFARGFDADARVYQDRYPNLSQAHRLRNSPLRSTTTVSNSPCAPSSRAWKCSTPTRPAPRATGGRRSIRGAARQGGVRASAGAADPSRAPLEDHTPER